MRENCAKWLEMHFVPEMFVVNLFSVNTSPPITCKNSYSAFPVCVWTVAVCFFGLVFSVIWSYDKLFWKRQCCVQLLLILIACWLCSSILQSVTKTQTIDNVFFVHWVANARNANLRCKTWTVNECSRELLGASFPTWIIMHPSHLSRGLVLLWL
jgi:uncharacterized membrane protein